MPRTLDGLRGAIRAIDEEILELAARRVELAQAIGDEKLKRDLPIQDFSVEKRVIDSARAKCRQLGIDEAIGEHVLRPLIYGAVKVQENRRVRRKGSGTGRRVLIIGGAGLMGRWFADFLASQGHRVSIADPSGPVDGYEHVAEFEDAARSQDVIIVATPPSVTAAILDDLGRTDTRAVIFDICSLKSPIKGALEGLVARGYSVCSIHPMFGPQTDMLSGKHVIVCPLGDPRAVQTVRAFFQDTCAGTVEMSLEQHDHLVAYVLGLSHAVNIVFNDVLARSGRPLAAIRHVASTTFENQIRVAEPLAYENPHLYYEIQALNDYTGHMLDSMEASIQRIMRDIRSSDREDFVGIMERARSYYQAYEDARGNPTPPGDEPMTEVS